MDEYGKVLLEVRVGSSLDFCNANANAVAMMRRADRSFHVVGILVRTFRLHVYWTRYFGRLHSFFFGVVDIPTCRISRASTYLKLNITIFSQHRPIKICLEFLYASKILSTQRFTAPFQSAGPGMV